MGEAETAEATDTAQALAGRRVVVTRDGPYRVEGGVRLLRTAIGHSRNKPFCDGGHKRRGFADPAMPLRPR